MKSARKQKRRLTLYELDEGVLEEVERGRVQVGAASDIEAAEGEVEQVASGTGDEVAPLQRHLAARAAAPTRLPVGHEEGEQPPDEPDELGVLEQQVPVGE